MLYLLSCTSTSLYIVVHLAVLVATIPRLRCVHRPLFYPLAGRQLADCFCVRTCMCACVFVCVEMRSISFEIYYMGPLYFYLFFHFPPLLYIKLEFGLRSRSTVCTPQHYYGIFATSCTRISLGSPTKSVLCFNGWGDNSVFDFVTHPLTPFQNVVTKKYVGFLLDFLQPCKRNTLLFSYRARGAR